MVTRIRGRSAACPVWAAPLPVLAVVALVVATATAAPPDTVFLEELTWTELRVLIAGGAGTAIVPIGGTEQNGPHIALGKHNVRVRALAERVARTLGGTLIAPVIAYVPEGELTPPSGHMRFPGTITVSEETFRRTLEAAARSLRLAGFRNVVFLGDHGSTQTGERAVAGKLSREWAGARVRVVAIPEYYRAATTGFRELLRAKGYRADELGEHADLADTSLTLALEPRLVRTTGVEAPPSGPTGADGDARRASAELGRLGIELIVSRTVAAIKESIK